MFDDDDGDDDVDDEFSLRHALKAALWIPCDVLFFFFSY